MGKEEEEKKTHPLKTLAAANFQMHGLLGLLVYFTFVHLDGDVHVSK